MDPNQYNQFNPNQFNPNPNNPNQVNQNLFNPNQFNSNPNRPPYFDPLNLQTGYFTQMLGFRSIRLPRSTHPNLKIAKNSYSRLNPNRNRRRKRRETHANTKRRRGAVKARPERWTPAEELGLANAWHVTSENPIHGMVFFVNIIIFVFVPYF